MVTIDDFHSVCISSIAHLIQRNGRHLSAGQKSLNDQQLPSQWPTNRYHDDDRGPRLSSRRDTSITRTCMTPNSKEKVLVTLVRAQGPFASHVHLSYLAVGRTLCAALPIVRTIPYTCFGVDVGSLATAASLLISRLAETSSGRSEWEHGLDADRRPSGRRRPRG